MENLRKKLNLNEEKIAREVKRRATLKKYFQEKAPQVKDTDSDTEYENLRGWAMVMEMLNENKDNEKKEEEIRKKAEMEKNAKKLEWHL